MDNEKRYTLDEIDNLASYFPKPMRALISLFQSECRIAIRGILSRLDLVSKQDYLVQKKLLAVSLEQINVLEKRIDELEMAGKEEPLR